MNGLPTLFLYAIPLLMAAVLLVLIVGVVNFARRDHSPRTSNKLMQWRVGLRSEEHTSELQSH